MCFRVALTPRAVSGAHQTSPAPASIPSPSAAGLTSPAATRNNPATPALPWQRPTVTITITITIMHRADQGEHLRRPELKRASFLRRQQRNGHPTPALAY